MANKSALRKVADAITGLSVAISNTFVEQAAIIAAECFTAFNGSLDIEKSDIVTIQDAVEADASWKGSEHAGTRRSEVKNIVMSYLWIEEAVTVFRDGYGSCGREQFQKVARNCCDPEMPDATTAAMYAVDKFQARDAGKGGKGGKVASLGMGLGIIKNTQKPPKGLTKTRMNAFRRELKALCDKYGVSY